MFSKLSSWINKYKKYFFRYRNGFYEFPFIANSPQRVAKAYTDAPFIKHDKVNRKFLIGSLFLDAKVKFYEIEEGFWIYFVEVTHKKKIKYVPIYEANERDDYYMFTINEVQDKFQLKAKNERRDFYMESTFWTLFKPRGHIPYTINKNTSTRCINIHFDDAWLKKNILEKKEWKNTKAVEFFESPQTKLTWSDSSGINLDKAFRFTQMINYNKADISEQELDQYLKKLIHAFFSAFDNPSNNFNYFDLSDSDREKIFNIERYLSDHLMADFAGIDFLSKYFHVSPTKLKADFRTIYGASVFQYFRERQMNLAAQLIKTKNYSINEVAAKFGYESASKFALAFKKCKGISPSEI